MQSLCHGLGVLLAASITPNVHAHRRAATNLYGGTALLARPGGACCYVAFALFQWCELQKLFDSLYAFSNFVERRIGFFAGFVNICR